MRWGNGYGRAKVSGRAGVCGSGEKGSGLCKTQSSGEQRAMNASEGTHKEENMSGRGAASQRKKPLRCTHEGCPAGQRGPGG